MGEARLGAELVPTPSVVEPETLAQRVEQALAEPEAPPVVVRQREPVEEVDPVAAAMRDVAAEIEALGPRAAPAAAMFDAIRRQSDTAELDVLERALDRLDDTLAAILFGAQE